LQRRGNPEAAAHGYLHRALAHARLKDGANVSTMLLQILANKSVFRSLMTSHYPNYNTYNADVAHTIPGIVIEMLVDSLPGTLEFLPALPNYLTQGTITGVLGRNQVTVNSLSWNLNEKTITATIVSAATQQITLISRRGIGSISSSATLTSSSLGSFARVISLQAGVSTSISIALPGSTVTPATTPTAASTATPTPLPTATAPSTPTPAPTATFTPTATPTPIAPGGYAVNYAVNQWPGGFTANLTIANTSTTAITGWTLVFTFPGTQMVTQGWGGSFSQQGNVVTITNLSYNSSIPAGSSITLGFNASWSGSNPMPTSFTLNGQPCTVTYS